jgi:hypothetical protein
VYRDMALYCWEEQEKLSNYWVLRYGIILWGETGEVIKMLCIEIWQYTARRDRIIYRNIA